MAGIFLIHSALMMISAANALVGNPPHAAALEVAMGGLKLRAVGNSAVALTGADCQAILRRGPDGAH